MELKAIHLIRRLERIDRDLEELNSLQQGIREDREYASRIIDPLMEESSRLKKLRTKILSQIIKNPPENLTEGIQFKKNVSGDVEITVRPDKKTPAATAEVEKKSSTPVPELTKSQTPAASKQKKGNPYRFIFDQNG